MNGASSQAHVIPDTDIDIMNKKFDRRSRFVFTPIHLEVGKIRIFRDAKGNIHNKDKTIYFIPSSSVLKTKYGQKSSGIRYKSLKETINT